MHNFSQYMKNIRYACRSKIFTRLGDNKLFSAVSNAFSNDTIFALSSGPISKSGISVIRLSGSHANYCLQSLCKKPGKHHAGTIKERIASLRYLYCPLTGAVLDQSIVLWFPGPKSFTGEDVVELHVHGSRAVIVGIFSALKYLDETQVNSSGGAIRPAERGEFTRRAFENGRMDLTEIEGLADLLDADTAQQRKQALRQMDGHQRRIFEAWRQELVHCLAHTEAVIDFADDDREDDINDDALLALTPRVTGLVQELERHLGDGHRGEMVREGIRIALAGPPNAGKSSLLNALAKRPAAIVSPIAGTTRDVVEVRLDLCGVPCTVSDTAGLRVDSSDPVELEGMRRAREEFGRAHIKLFVADSSSTESMKSAMDLLALVTRDDAESSSTALLVVLNKSDIAVAANLTDPLSSAAMNKYNISCVTGEGLSVLELAISQTVQSLLETGSTGDSPLITRERHRRHVSQCVEHLKRFLSGRLPMDAATEELRLGMMELGKVTGRVDVEELLDVIFRDFCIGK